MHAGALGRPREQRVEQVRAGEPSIRDFGSYLPAEQVAERLRDWREQGAWIDYLSSHRDPSDVSADSAVISRHRLPDGRVLYRGPGESYGDVLARELPDLLIEDDCESIGRSEMAHPQLPAELRARIKSVVVPEFAGFAGLPASLEELLAYGRRR